MIGRLFWFAAGAGVAVWAVGKVKASLHRATPEAVSQRVAASLGGLGSSARDFADRVRAGMAEREAELRAEMEQRGTKPDRLGLTE